MGLSRAIRLRVCPPMLVNCPPTRILPSGCSVIAMALSFAFGLKESATPVEPSSRAMKLRVAPPMVGVPLPELKSPPTKILPSACSTIDSIASFAFGLNESGRPVTWHRAGRCGCAPVRQR